MAVFCEPFGTTESIWFWIRTVVRGIQRKLLPNQKALSPACLRLPNPAAARPSTAAAVATGARLAPGAKKCDVSWRRPLAAYR